MLFKISNSFFYTQKVAYFVFKDSSSPVKASSFNPLSETSYESAAEDHGLADTQRIMDNLKFTRQQILELQQADSALKPRPSYAVSPTKPDQNMTNLRCTADHHAVPPLNIRPVESGVIPDHFSTDWTTYPAHHDLSERARPIPAVF